MANISGTSQAVGHEESPSCASCPMRSAVPEQHLGGFLSADLLKQLIYPVVTRQEPRCEGLGGVGTSTLSFSPRLARRPCCMPMLRAQVAPWPLSAGRLRRLAPGSPGHHQPPVAWGAGNHPGRPPGHKPGASPALSVPVQPGEHGRRAASVRMVLALPAPELDVPRRGAVPAGSTQPGARCSHR